jgi:hypothetical protein
MSLSRLELGNIARYRSKARDLRNNEVTGYEYQQGQYKPQKMFDQPSQGNCQNARHFLFSPRLFKAAAVANFQEDKGRTSICDFSVN